jgi:hypothetical protein
VAVTPNTALRIPPELVEAARERVGTPDMPVTVLVRAGLAVLAGLPVREALRTAQTRPGPKPRTGAAV